MTSPLEPRGAGLRGNPAGASAPSTDVNGPLRFGWWLLGLGFGGFLLWAAFAPLDEGVPATGTVSVEAKRKRVDHLTGGIIQKILVRDGDRVAAGQELILLDGTQAGATLNASVGQWRMAVAAEARLITEREGHAAIVFPAELRAARAEPEVAAILQAQIELFRARRGALQKELAVIRESVSGLEDQVRSLEQLKSGREKQVALFAEQLASFRKLNVQGFASRNQLIEIERQLAEVQSRLGEDLANIASAKSRLAEFRLRGSQREIEYRREVETLLADIQRDASTLAERIVALRDTYARLSVQAPAAGLVLDLAYHTVGGVIKAGERILDIVPDGEGVVIEAQLAPQYVDRARAGGRADVHFDAYGSRAERPVVAGRIAVVSADALVDQRTGAPYYAMRVAVPAEEVRKLGDLRLQPGMVATVMVRTGERSLLVYLARPFLRRFSSALSEP